MTKDQKSKILDDRFLGFSVAVVLVYSVFSVDAVFMEKFVDQNCQYWKFSKKHKKGCFHTAKLGPYKYFLSFFSSPILSACPRGSFSTPKLLSRIQNGYIYHLYINNMTCIQIIAIKHIIIVYVHDYRN